MGAVGRVGRCQGETCLSKFCWRHGERNKRLWSADEFAGEVLPRRGWIGPQPMPTPASGFRAWTTEERERELLGRDSGHFGVLPLAPRRRRALGAVASVAAGMGMVLVAVLVALGVVHLIGLLGGR